MEDILTLIALAITIWILVDSSKSKTKEEKKVARKQIVWILIVLFIIVNSIVVYFIFIKEDYAAFGNFSVYLKYTWFVLCLFWVFKKIFTKSAINTK